MDFMPFLWRASIDRRASTDGRPSIEGRSPTWSLILFGPSDGDERFSGISGIPEMQCFQAKSPAIATNSDICEISYGNPQNSPYCRTILKSPVSHQRTYIGQRTHTGTCDDAHAQCS